MNELDLSVFVGYSRKLGNNPNTAIRVEIAAGEFGCSKHGAIKIVSC